MPWMCPPCAPCPPCALISLWPRLHTLSALCPPCVRLVSALCPPWARFDPGLPARHVSASKPCTPYVRLQILSASCVSCVCIMSSICPPPSARSLPAQVSQVHHVSPPLDFIRSWPALRNHPRLYCMPAGQFPWRSFWLRKFWPLQAHPMLEKLFGYNFFVIFLRDLVGWRVPCAWKHFGFLLLTSGWCLGLRWPITNFAAWCSRC